MRSTCARKEYNMKVKDLMFTYEVTMSYVNNGEHTTTLKVNSTDPTKAIDTAIDHLLDNIKQAEDFTMIMVRAKQITTERN